MTSRMSSVNCFSATSGERARRGLFGRITRSRSYFLEVDCRLITYYSTSPRAQFETRIARQLVKKWDIPVAGVHQALLSIGGKRSGREEPRSPATFPWYVEILRTKVYSYKMSLSSKFENSISKDMVELQAKITLTPFLEVL